MKIIRAMPSMQGINEESLPRFDFFQIKRSCISNFTDKNEDN